MIDLLLRAEGQGVGFPPPPPLALGSHFQGSGGGGGSSPPPPPRLNPLPHNTISMMVPIRFANENSQSRFLAYLYS